MGWPQFIYLALTFVGLGLAWERDGRPKTGEYSVVTDLIATAIVCGLLYAGGFFG